MSALRLRSLCIALTRNVSHENILVLDAMRTEHDSKLLKMKLLVVGGSSGGSSKRIAEHYKLLFIYWLCQFHMQVKKRNECALQFAYI